MKTACTAFVMIILATSCAKKFSMEDSLDTINRNFATTDKVQVLSSSTGNKSILRFNEDKDFTIPDFINISSGVATNQYAKIFFDYSDITNSYAYFCRYYPSSDLDVLEFENCFLNQYTESQYDSIPSVSTQLYFHSGYRDLVRAENSIILEIFNDRDQTTINAEVQIETY